MRIQGKQLCFTSEQLLGALTVIAEMGNFEST